MNFTVSLLAFLQMVGERWDHRMIPEFGGSGRGGHGSVVSMTLGSANRRAGESDSEGGEVVLSSSSLGVL